ncbi:dTDP-4-dehydrorhamnose reductase [Halieaceae bacterium IMCC8485]|uniref:dTDP-4-dehydrorhamnose reductase n=1 Tax=Candidatus Seongchinamella marina TaxID=2518990 RepID=A0ABT3SUY3_9GAMM|nr:dTDP-4-dehydrorhamnose reductase [Candidatus Seongchinamella marina]MCX2973740.1 dTDP-4-dehydrorhamnose reductase [Candidatus Seongchinamella marina]
MIQKVLITGAAGQLGRELLRTMPEGVECIAATREILDIADAAQVRALVRRERPGLIINAAAYTAVDKAESEQELAAAINVNGAANLATACAENESRLIHVSTDFVFDGTSSTPYLPDAPTSPLGEYGRSKLAGEQAVVAGLPSALIMRTAWVYSAFGGNFVKTMLRLMAEREELSVVADQVGTPTWARGLADALWLAADQSDLQGLYHWTDAGVCSWYDFAVAIAEEALEIGLLQRMPRIHPIPGSAYPTPAARPAFSVLDKNSTWAVLKTERLHWRSQLRSMLKELKESSFE